MTAARRYLTTASALSVVWVSLAGAASPAFTPTDQYQTQSLLGFTVRIHPELLQHRDELVVGLEELERQLQGILQVVPEGPRQELVKTPIWVEWRVQPRGACEVHVSADWLQDNGYNPDKLYGVEINNLRNFVAWSRTTQPWMVLHELAHAYHHRVLGRDHPLLTEAFTQAQASGRYERVAFVSGGQQRHYALTNVAEYFAELTEAYFGRNDFAPFDAEALRAFDPTGFDMCRQIWGEPLKTVK